MSTCGSWDGVVSPTHGMYNNRWPVTSLFSFQFANHTMQPTTSSSSVYAPRHNGSEVRRPERPSLPSMEAADEYESAILTAEDKDIADAMSVALDDRVIAQVIDMLF
ncbi:hypothetical protein SDRG_04122 [Saprolegnia diclina VS20]|uniref:Uncharacterized protein n=1 Tax=Saprolegnia diclina (strain VS20) TaxID=1156394 RepID=T0QUR4_SAPDV|nr:hypothetical protein SDRG_04122 [Saprolegnia diclina VS20]EQC38411.1 hypothetical protein SDRG_04122 [Saprolegnia diclina VS20]|eukprot:XP_008608003.1 hypothetical protein SDRG_04122 [Saprolegnia diclina VS20]